VLPCRPWCHGWIAAYDALAATGDDEGGQRDAQSDTEGEGLTEQMLHAVQEHKQENDTCIRFKNVKLIEVNEQLARQNEGLQKRISVLKHSIGELELNKKHKELEAQKARSLAKLGERIATVENNVENLLSEKWGREQTLSARQIAINLESALMKFVWPKCRRDPFYISIELFVSDIKEARPDRARLPPKFVYFLALYSCTRPSAGPA